MRRRFVYRLQFSTSAVSMLASAPGFRMDHNRCQAIIIGAALTLRLACVEHGNIVLVQ